MYFVQERESGYNAFEKDVAVLNVFFGQPTTFGNKLCRIPFHLYFL